MNKVIQLGRITKDLEIRKMNDDKSVLNFDIAVQRKFKNKEGKYDSDFFSVVAYGAQADYIAKFSKGKGGRIEVSGRLQNKSWDKEGVKHYKTEIIAEEVEIIDWAGEGQASSGSSGREEMEEVQYGDGDIPF